MAVEEKKEAIQFKKKRGNHGRRGKVSFETRRPLFLRLVWRAREKLEQDMNTNYL
jgi:hypothetical protein